jgi:hypothetical protein
MVMYENGSDVGSKVISAASSELKLVIIYI